MRLVDLLWYLPLALAVALVLGASGRDGPKAIAKGTVHAFFTLTVVLGGVGVVIRLLVILLT